jgi:hypothetical protein
VGGKGWLLALREFTIEVLPETLSALSL